MQITVEISEQVVTRAEAEGVSVESFVKSTLEKAAQPKSHRDWDRLPPGPFTPEEAGHNIRELSKRLTLGGLKIKDLIDDGRKY